MLKFMCFKIQSRSIYVRVIRVRTQNNFHPYNRMFFFETFLDCVQCCHNNGKKA